MRAGLDKPREEQGSEIGKLEIIHHVKAVEMMGSHQLCLKGLALTEPYAYKAINFTRKAFPSAGPLCCLWAVRARLPACSGPPRAS